MLRVRVTPQPLLSLAVAVLLCATVVCAQEGNTMSQSYVQSTNRSVGLAPPPGANWSSVFSEAEINCWRVAGEYCFTQQIEMPWGRSPFMQYAVVCVSPAGLLWLDNGYSTTCGPPHYQFPGFSLYPNKSQPDYRLLEPFTQGGYMQPVLAVLLGFAPTALWRADQYSMRYTQTADQFWLQGNVTSVTQGPDAPLPAVFHFTLCLHSNQSVQLDVGALTLHAGTDSTRTPMVGLLGAGYSATSTIVFASLWRPEMVAHAPAANYSARLDFTPYMEDNACMWMNSDTIFSLSCPSCVAAKCGWCSATSTCVNSTRSAACPSSPLLTADSQCPAEQHDACKDCTMSGLVWDADDGDCSLNSTTGVVTNCGPMPAWYDYRVGQRVQRCVPSVANVSALSCDATYNTSFMSCSAMSALGDNDFRQDWGCACAPNTLDTRAPQFRHVGNAQTCIECTSEACSRFMGSAHMECGYTMGDPFVQCVCAEAYYTQPAPGAILCDVCIPRAAYRAKDGSCQMCPSLSPGLVALLVLAAVLLTFGVVKLNSHPLIQRLLIPVSNAVVYCQVVSLLALIDFHWPLSVSRAFNAFTVAGFNLVSLPSATCYMTADERFYISLMAVPVITAILCVTMLAIMVRNECCMVRGPVSRRAAHAMNSRFRILFIRSFLSVLLLMYNFLVYTSFEGLSSLVPGRGSAQDVLSVLGTIVYVLGIPMLFVSALAERSERRWVANLLQGACCCRREDQRSNVLQPLRGRYRAGMHYWEALFVPLWKIILNALIVWASRTVQIVSIALLLFVLILAHARFKPYSSGLNNREQVWLLCGSLTILFSGVLFYFSSDDDSSAWRSVELLSYVLVASTMLLMAAVIVYVIASVVRQYRAELKGAAKLVGDEEWEQQPGHAGAEPPPPHPAASVVGEEGDAESTVVPGAASLLVDSELKLMGSKTLYDSLLSAREDESASDEGGGQPAAQSVSREGMPDAL